MRSEIDTDQAFVAGLMVGLGLAGVALVVLGATRRVRRRQLKRGEPVFVIDGVRPPNPVELEARPAEEANCVPRRLESEAVDVSPLSQRW